MEYVGYILGAIGLASAIYFAIRSKDSGESRKMAFLVPAPIYVGTPLASLILRNMSEFRIIETLVGLLFLLGTLAAAILVIWIATAEYSRWTSPKSN